jgi:hypothetical protein
MKPNFLIVAALVPLFNIAVPALALDPVISPDGEPAAILPVVTTVHAAGGIFDVAAASDSLFLIMYAPGGDEGSLAGPELGRLQGSYAVMR